MTYETDKIEADINRSRHALNDTIEQLGGKLSPGQILDEALGLAKGQAGEFTANLGRQVRDHPLPVLLIGAGIGMLLMKHKGGDAEAGHEDRHAESSYRNLEQARTGVIRQPDESDDDFQHRLHEAEAAAMGLKQSAGEAIEAFKARVKSAADGVSHTAQGIRDRVSEGAASTAHFFGEQAHNLKAGAGEAKHRAQAFYDEYPLAAGAIGLGIGALVGALAPLSSVERESLHGVAGAAAKAGADLAEKGARAVERSADKTANALH